MSEDPPQLWLGGLFIESFCYGRIREIGITEKTIENLKLSKITFSDLDPDEECHEVILEIVSEAYFEEPIEVSFFANNLGAEGFAIEIFQGIIDNVFPLGLPEELKEEIRSNKSKLCLKIVDVLLKDSVFFSNFISPKVSSIFFHYDADMQYNKRYAEAAKRLRELAQYIEDYKF